MARKLTQVTQADLERLHEVAQAHAEASVPVKLPADLLFVLARELLDARDELFRIRVADTVDDVLDEQEVAGVRTAARGEGGRGPGAGGAGRRGLVAPLPRGYWLKGMRGAGRRGRGRR